MRVEADFVSQRRCPVGEVGPKPNLILGAGETVTREEWVEDEPKG